MLLARFVRIGCFFGLLELYLLMRSKWSVPTVIFLSGTLGLFFGALPV